jgi:hypothetical protein
MGIKCGQSNRGDVLFCKESTRLLLSSTVLLCPVLIKLRKKSMNVLELQMVRRGQPTLQHGRESIYADAGNSSIQAIPETVLIRLF